MSQAASTIAAMNPDLMARVLDRARSQAEELNDGELPVPESLPIYLERVEVDTSTPVPEIHADERKAFAAIAGHFIGRPQMVVSLYYTFDNPKAKFEEDELGFAQAQIFKAEEGLIRGLLFSGLAYRDSSDRLAMGFPLGLWRFQWSDNQSQMIEDEKFPMTTNPQAAMEVVIDYVVAPALDELDSFSL